MLILVILLSIPLQAKTNKPSYNNPSNPPKYQGFDYNVGIGDVNLGNVADKYNNAMTPVRQNLDKLKGISEKSKEVFGREFSWRKWHKIGGLDGAIKDRIKTLSNYANKWTGNMNLTGVGTNVFVVHITSKVIVPPLVKIAKKAVSEVEKNLTTAVEKTFGKADEFENRMINKVYDKLGVNKLEEKINSAIDKVKEADAKVNKFILTGTDKIGEFKQDIDTLVNAGYDINDMFQDDNGNLLVKIGNVYIKSKDIVKTLNKYAKNPAVEKGIQKTEMVEGFINEWDMIAERKIRNAINSTSYELGYLLADEIIARNDYVKNLSYQATPVGKKVVTSGVPIGRSTPDMTRPFERYNVDKVFLENTPLGFKEDESNPADKKYKENERFHKETTEIFVDNFKEALTGKPKDSTDGNVIGYKKPKVAKDSVQKTAYTNAPFIFDEDDEKGNEKNATILKAIPRVQTEKQLRTELEATKMAQVLKATNLISTGTGSLGVGATVTNSTVTKGGYSALVYKPPRKVWIEYYGNSTGVFKSEGKTDPILTSKVLQNTYFETEKKYNKMAEDSVRVLQEAYDTQMAEMGTTHLTGFEKDETKQGRTAESSIINKAKANNVKELLNSENSYMLAEDNHDYINENQDKRKKLYKERAEIEKIANAVKNEHNAFRDWQNAYYNDLVFEQAFDVYYGNFKAEFFKDEAKKNPERFKQMSREDRKKKNKLLAQSFGEDTNKIVEAKKKLDNLLRRRMMVIEQLNRNLGNQGARFKTMLDAVEYVKKHLEDSDSQESQERNALNLKRLYQAMAVITSQTREEIGLISKNVINSKRTEEIEKMLLAEIETEMKLDIYDNEIRSGKAPNFVMEKNEVKKILKDPEYLFKYNK
jgi:hypothetical protein